MVENIKYKLCEDKDGVAMVTIKNFPGLDCDLYGFQLRDLIQQLTEISYNKEFKNVNFTILKPTVIEGIKVNPKLPDCFHKMAIEDMPSNVLDEWMNVPYIAGYGKAFSVYCLDGGVWDRPTHKCDFNNIDNAIIWVKNQNLHSLKM